MKIMVKDILNKKFNTENNSDNYKNPFNDKSLFISILF